MTKQNLRHHLWHPRHRAALAMVAAALSASNLQAEPVPGFVAPVTQTPVAEYVDDTRGVYVPQHEQLRQKNIAELTGWSGPQLTNAGKPLYAQQNPSGETYERALNMVATGVADTGEELDRIASEPGLLAGGSMSNLNSQNLQIAQIQPAAGPTSSPARAAPNDLSQYPSLATGGRPRVQTGVQPNMQGMTDLGSAPMAASSGRDDGGVELAIGGQVTNGRTVTLENGIVRLKEERISIRRALQRMLDQIGGGSWTTVWDLDEVNAGLPDMEISIYAEEPFVKVLNALLARMQTRSGQPLRVIKYDKTQRLVITDRVGGGGKSAGIGGGNEKGGSVAVTETVLKESKVSLHYDEIPLVDALENVINQAGRGQWRLRMYAGTDQVLKPAHIEEPFGVAIERILKVFNLRYEVFPGGKLIVVTSSDKFGFKGVE